MSTRIKVFNYVMSAPLDEVNQTLDEARALAAQRKVLARTGTANVGKTHTAKPKLQAKQPGQPLTPQAKGALTKAANKAKLAAEAAAKSANGALPQSGSGTLAATL